MVLGISASKDVRRNAAVRGAVLSDPLDGVVGIYVGLAMFYPIYVTGLLIPERP